MINPISHIKFNKSFCIILVVSLVSFCVYGKDNSLIYTNINTNSTAFFNNSLSYKNSFDWKKHKSYKIYAWTSLSVGGAMMVIGVIGNQIDHWEGTAQHNRFKILGYCGIGVAAVSVPLFVLSYKHKKKAISLGAGNQTMYAPFSNCSIQQYPALSINLNF